MRGPWSHARPEIYVKREDLKDILSFAWRRGIAHNIQVPSPDLMARLLQVIEMGGTLTIIEDTAKARSGDAPYR